MSRPSGSELRERLRAGLVERLAPAGWHEVEARGDFRLAAFVRPMGDEIVATLAVSQSVSYGYKPPVRVISLSAGAGYEPLRSTASLEAWLDWDPGGAERLAVFVGEEAVGRLDESATAAYRAAMEAAGERDESPYAPARLTPRPPPAGYLLEIQLPSE